MLYLKLQQKKIKNKEVCQEKIDTDTETQTKIYYFKDGRRGFSRIQGLVQDAINHPGLSRPERMASLDKADGIAKLIGNPFSRALYETMIRETRENIQPELEKQEKIYSPNKNKYST